MATFPTVSQVAITIKIDLALGKFHQAESARSNKILKLNTGNICSCCGKENEDK